MKTLWDFLKDIGIPGALSILCLLFGLSFVLDSSVKDLLELNVQQHGAPSARLGVFLCYVGLFVTIAWLAIVVSREKKIDDRWTARIADVQKALQGYTARQAAYQHVMNKLTGHKALSWTDTPELLWRVRESAERIQLEMNELIDRSDYDEYTKELCVEVRRFAKQFNLDLESNLEVRQQMDLDETKVRTTMLPPELRAFVSDAHDRWRHGTEALCRGAALMLGMKGREFGW